MTNIKSALQNCKDFCTAVPKIFHGYLTYGRYLGKFCKEEDFKNSIVGNLWTAAVSAITGEVEGLVYSALLRSYEVGGVEELPPIILLLSIPAAFASVRAYQALREYNKS
jgi:hypothetical protein